MIKNLLRVFFQILIMVILIDSCGLSKRIENGVGQGFNSILVSQVAMTKFLVESSNSIFTNDSVKPGKSIYINYLQASFITYLDTFYLHMDSIVAQHYESDSIKFNKLNIIGDSVIYESLNIPYLVSVKLPDSFEVKIVCKYRPYADFEKDYWKWLHSEYFIKEHNIILKNKRFN